MTTPNYEDLIAQLKQKDVDLGDARDVVLHTERAREAFYGTKRDIACTISGLMNAPAELAKRQARYDDVADRRPLVVAAQVEIERLIDDQPDYREIRDRRERDREWGRQLDLLAARRALVNGCEWMSGYPCVPNALKKIFGTTTERDGRVLPNWPGSLRDIDDALPALTERRDRAANALAHCLAEAERLLGEQVPA